MKTFKAVLLGLVLSVGVQGANYPVDVEIEELRDKANHLEALKELFLNNTCAVELEGNRVGLVAGALRSEGLVMAIGKNFPGNYLAYHKAPKAQFLRNVIVYTLKKANAADGAVIVAGKLLGGKQPTHLEVSFNKPFFVKGTDGLWIYSKQHMQIELPHDGTSVSKSGRLKDGRTVKLECN